MNPRQKPCVRGDCDGIMCFDDAEWPSYATWVCERNPDHREVVEGECREFRPAAMKPCTFAGCDGMMVEDNIHGLFAAKWLCNRNDDHREIDPVMWRLHKDDKTAHFGMLRHPFGHELRLTVGDELLQSQVCSSYEELETVQKQWRAAMIAKGWIRGTAQ